ncbi:Protein of unknown function DUF247, plant [Dillenia turbinata]|uniref:Uncharacterized protein n=1 Tax=Dillenia turbinata TaxID=194707 RepID=A0AAN8UT70_9MAGN
MSHLKSSSISSQNPDIDEDQWVIQIKKGLEEELDEDTELPASIFSVPKTIVSSSPEFFYPQEVAIGPYHHWRSELYEMERYKLLAAKLLNKQLQQSKFEDVVEQLSKHEFRIRAYYHKYLDFKGDTLAWMMAIDASFLLQLLQVFVLKESGKELTRVSSRMSNLLDFAGMKSAHNALLRDMVMLENQIPLFVLQKVLETRYFSEETANEILLSMLMGMCKNLLPFKVIHETSKIEVDRYAHLLDFMYGMIMAPQAVEDSLETTEIEEKGKELKDHMITSLQAVEDSLKTTEILEKEKVKDEEELLDSSTVISQAPDQTKNLSTKLLKLLQTIRKKLFTNLSKGALKINNKIVLLAPIKIILKLPLTLFSKIPGLSLIAQPLESLFSSKIKKSIKPEEESSSDTMSKPPLVEEIAIPSVSELSKLGVRFEPLKDGTILDIDFDMKTFTLCLPVINLDVNSEVVLRNLVAYEVSVVSGPLVFTRYCELMAGIIDTEDDLKLLREKGIVVNRLKKDAEATNIWNGMNKSIKLNKVEKLDKVIENVNKYYANRWKIRSAKYLKKYGFGSWRCLTLLAAVFFLLMTALQSFCSVYSCSRLLHLPYLRTTN